MAQASSVVADAANDAPSVTPVHELNRPAVTDPGSNGSDALVHPNPTTTTQEPSVGWAANSVTVRKPSGSAPSGNTSVTSLPSRRMNHCWDPVDRALPSRRRTERTDGAASSGTTTAIWSGAVRVTAMSGAWSVHGTSPQMPSRASGGTTIRTTPDTRSRMATLPRRRLVATRGS